jgi:hypothetical protein
MLCCYLVSLHAAAGRLCMWLHDVRHGPKLICTSSAPRMLHDAWHVPGSFHAASTAARQGIKQRQLSTKHRICGSTTAQPPASTGGAPAAASPGRRAAVHCLRSLGPHQSLCSWLPSLPQVVLPCKDGNPAPGDEPGSSSAAAAGAEEGPEVSVWRAQSQVWWQSQSKALGWRAGGHSSSSSSTGGWTSHSSRLASASSSKQQPPAAYASSSAACATQLPSSSAG